MYVNVALSQVSTIRLEYIAVSTIGCNFMRIRSQYFEQRLINRKVLLKTMAVFLSCDLMFGKLEFLDLKMLFYSHYVLNTKKHWFFLLLKITIFFLSYGHAFKEKYLIR